MQSKTLDRVGPNKCVYHVKTDGKGKIDNHNGTYKNTDPIKTNVKFNEETHLALGVVLTIIMMELRRINNVLCLTTLGIQQPPKLIKNGMFNMRYLALNP